MTQLGVRAFRTVSELFQLVDTQSVGELDLGVASPIFDLQNNLVASLGRYTRFVLTISATAAGNPNNTNARPGQVGDWTEVSGTAGALAIPARDAMLVAGIGIHVATPANFTDAKFIQADGGGSPAFLVASWQNLIDNVGVPDGAPGYYKAPMPELRTLGFSYDFQANVSGNTDVTLMMDILSGPPGLFPSPIA